MIGIFGIGLWIEKELFYYVVWYTKGTLLCVHYYGIPKVFGFSNIFCVPKSSKLHSIMARGVVRANENK